MAAERHPPFAKMFPRRLVVQLQKARLIGPRVVIPIFLFNVIISALPTCHILPIFVNVASHITADTYAAVSPIGVEGAYIFGIDECLSDGDFQIGSMSNSYLC